MKTIWNNNLDIILADAYVKMCKCNFHKNERKQSPPRWVKNIGFWNAVAVSVAMKSDHMPTPGACEKRWPIVFDRITDPNSKIDIDLSIINDLSLLDDKWAHTSVIVMEDLLEQIDIMKDFARKIIITAEER